MRISTRTEGGLQVGKGALKGLFRSDQVWWWLMVESDRVLSVMDHWLEGKARPSACEGDRQTAHARR